jgi:hypothetical protein
VGTEHELFDVGRLGRSRDPDVTPVRTQIEKARESRVQVGDEVSDAKHQNEVLAQKGSRPKRPGVERKCDGPVLAHTDEAARYVDMRIVEACGRGIRVHGCGVRAEVDAEVGSDPNGPVSVRPTDRTNRGWKVCGRDRSLRLTSGLADRPAEVRGRRLCGR